jgi:uncharacterized membrane protein YcjF (UPF0283 family)
MIRTAITETENIVHIVPRFILRYRDVQQRSDLLRISARNMTQQSPHAVYDFVYYCVTSHRPSSACALGTV